LLAAFERVVTRWHSGRWCSCPGIPGSVSPPSSTRCTRCLFLPRGPFFASGKFDQYKRDIPLFDSGASLSEPDPTASWGKSEAELGGWARGLLRGGWARAHGSWSTWSPNWSSSLENRRPFRISRHRTRKRRFFSSCSGDSSASFARPEHPLALFLDDLQWLDAATLDLLEDSADPPGCAAPADHRPPIGTMRSIPPIRCCVCSTRFRQTGAVAQEITLTPLTGVDLGRLIADALRSAPDDAAELGAPWCTRRRPAIPSSPFSSLSALAEEGLLDVRSWRRAMVLECRSDFTPRGYTDNVVGPDGREAQPPAPLLPRRHCSSSPASATSRTSRHCVSFVGPSEEEVHSDLWEAVRLELIVRLDGVYRFVHDRVQEAALFTDPGRLARRGPISGSAGCSRRTRCRKKAGRRRSFAIVNQLNRGAALITGRDEREQLAELNLIAGKRATASTAYASALTYLVAGAALLAEDSWERRHELSFALELKPGRMRVPEPAR